MIVCPVTGARIDHVTDRPLLAYGFRPFFLFAGIYGALAVPLWLLIWLGELPFDPALAPSRFHAHEMLFGFAGAALAGFLLTAVPNWTGEGPVRGEALLVLAVAWLAGRGAMWLSGALDPRFVAVADCAFLPLLAAFQAPAIVRRGAWRNLIFVAILLALFLANIATHLAAIGVLDHGNWGQTLALDVFVLAIALVGGRIVPAFTQGGLKAQGVPTAIEPRPRLDMIAVLSVAAMSVADAVQGEGRLAGSLAALAAAANLVRLLCWQGHRTWRWPLLWVLHAGMAWLVAGLALKAAAAFDMAPPAAALHALGAGAAGTMILAVMTRATLGHTGRKLVAVPGSAFGYLAVALGALCRVMASFSPGAGTALTVLGGMLWAGGFVVFLWLYGGMLVSRRPDGRPG